jgi:hypothetical protein
LDNASAGVYGGWFVVECGWAQQRDSLFRVFSIGTIALFLNLSCCFGLNIGNIALLHLLFFKDLPKV